MRPAPVQTWEERRRARERARLWSYVQDCAVAYGLGLLAVFAVLTLFAGMVVALGILDRLLGGF